MASNRSFKDLELLTQAIKSETINLQIISFHLSQPTSKCSQETENSITVNLSRDDHFHFSNLLTVLRRAKSLKNLEFHQIEWEPKQLKDLQILLDSHSNIKQLMFGRNSFDKECLSEFSDVLKKNRVVKEIMICESGIGSTGAALLASALKANNTLEELQIWDDSIGSKGAEEFSKMIEVNTTLKQLTIFDSNSGIATALISAVLARNRVVEVHIWSKENGEKTSKVVEFAPGNSMLRIYKLDFSGSCTVACALGLNTTVRSLDMSGVRLKSRWAREFRWVLEQNQSLKEVNLSNTRLKNKGVVYVSAGLFRNRSLEHLSVAGNWFSGIGIEHLLTPLTRFSSLYFSELKIAGKSSLCNSIAKNFSSSKLPYMDQVRNLVQPVEEAVKPVGMKIKTFKDEDNKISIWNLAGQYEFYPLHDLMFPGHGSASCFFIISSLFRKPNNQEPKNAIEIEEDLQYWLRFVVSNSRRAVQQCMLPNVTIVLTHFDKINQPSNNMQLIVNAIQRLKDKFQGFIEFYPTVFTVDARSSVSVNKLTHHIKKTSNTILQRVPRVYELCNDEFDQDMIVKKRWK